MMPYDEPAAPDLAYTVTVGDDSGEVAQAPQPVVGVVTSTQGPETPATSSQKLSNSIASGDLTYALERLHPLVLKRSQATCAAPNFRCESTPDYNITLNSVGDTAPWTWELPDGRSYEVEAATTVSIVLPGTTEPVELTSSTSIASTTGSPSATGVRHGQTEVAQNVSPCGNDCIVATSVSPYNAFNMPLTIPRSTAQITGCSIATSPNGQWLLTMRSWLLR